MSSRTHKRAVNQQANPRLIAAEALSFPLILAPVVLLAPDAYNAALLNPAQYVTLGLGFFICLGYSTRISSLRTSSPHTLLPLIMAISTVYGQWQATLPGVIIIELICLSISYENIMLGALHTLSATLSAIPSALIFSSQFLRLAGEGTATLDRSQLQSLIGQAALPAVVSIASARLIAAAFDTLISLAAGNSVKAQWVEYCFTRIIVLTTGDIAVLIALPALVIVSSQFPGFWPASGIPIMLTALYAIVICVCGLFSASRVSRRKFSCLAGVQSSIDRFLSNPEQTALHLMRKGLHGFSSSIVPADENRGHSWRARRSSVVVKYADRPFYLVAERNVMQRPFTPSDVLVLNSIATIVNECLRVQHDAERLGEFDETDLLTGALSYRSFISYLQRLRTSNDVVSLAIIYIDIDRFKQINSKYGHIIGNKILHLIANRIRETLNSDSIVARVGGDEFAVSLINYESRDTIDALAADIRETVSIPAETEAGIVSVAVSTGISIAESKRDFDSLLSDANTRMYRSRALHNQSDQPPLDAGTAGSRGSDDDVSAISASDTVAHAIETNTIYTVYQPIVDMVERQIVSIEAQVRITDPRYGHLPVAFIVSEASRLGMSSTLAIDVLTRAMKDMDRFRAMSPNLTHMRMGVTGNEILDPEFLAQVEQLNVVHPDTTLGFDLDEESLRTLPEELVASFETFSSLPNVTLGLGHMGTSFSELRTLTQIPVTTMRIGRGLISDTSSTQTVEIIRKLVSVGSETGVATIFDGVDSQEQADYVAGLGGRYVQGSLYGNPVTGSELQMRMDAMGLSLDGSRAASQSEPVQKRLLGFDPSVNQIS